MDIETSEQLAFIPEQVESILMTVVDGILRTEVYLEEKVRESLLILKPSIHVDRTRADA